MGDEFNDETERVLIELHTDLTAFYTRHKKLQNCEEDVLTIIMQYYIDAGEDKLNEKLRKKYGEDLKTFKLNQRIPQVRKSLQPDTVRQLSRQSVSKDLAINLPPEPKLESNYDKQGKTHRHKRNGKGKREKRGKNLSTLSKPTYDKSTFTPEEMLSAFYTLHDPSKLKLEAVMKRFLQYIDENGIETFSKKLKSKYGVSLYDKSIILAATQRRNLQIKLQQFYERKDPDKLKSAWAIKEIISWTMANGVSNLNNKFRTRYGEGVV